MCSKTEFKSSKQDCGILCKCNARSSVYLHQVQIARLVEPDKKTKETHLITSALFMKHANLFVL